MHQIDYAFMHAHYYDHSGRRCRRLVNAKHMVELGTANRYSESASLWHLQATGGKRTTFELDPQRVKQAREDFNRAGVGVTLKKR
jgi:predicted O-methyltransferase YrrM